MNIKYFFLNISSILVAICISSITAKSQNNTIDIEEPMFISGKRLICQDKVDTYKLSNGSNSKWILRNEQGSVVSRSSGNQFIHHFSTPGTYRLQAKGRSPDTVSNLNIQVIPTPKIPNEIYGPDKVCLGIPTKFETDKPYPGTIYQWSINGDDPENIVYGDEAYLKILKNNAEIELRRITTEGAGCPSDPLKKKVISSLSPLTIKGPDTVCHSTEAAYIVNEEEAFFYEWEVFPSRLGSVIANKNSTNPIVLWNIALSSGETAILQLTMYKCGGRFFEQYPVFVQNAPQVLSISASEDSIYSGSEITIRLKTSYPIDSLSTKNYKWEWFDGPAIVKDGFPSTIGLNEYEFRHHYQIGTTSKPITFTPLLTVNSPNGCNKGFTVTVDSITVLPNPDIESSHAPVEPELCHDLLCDQEGGGYIIKLYECQSIYPTATLPKGTFYDHNWKEIPSIDHVAEVKVKENTSSTYHLIVDKPEGSCTSSVSINIPKLPQVKISLAPHVPNPACGDVLFEIQADARGEALEYWWDFDDESYSTSNKNPMKKIYENKDRSITVSLTVIDLIGCRDTAYLNLFLMDNPQKGTPVILPNMICPGEKATLHYEGIGINASPESSYTWYNQTDSFSSITDWKNKGIPITEPGAYWVKMVDHFGCITHTADRIGLLERNAIPEITIFADTNQLVNQEFTLRTQDYGSKYDYHWSGADSATGTALVQHLEKPGTYTYQVTITDKKSACSFTTEPFTITVSEGQNDK